MVITKSILLELLRSCFVVVCFSILLWLW